MKSSLLLRGALLGALLASPTFLPAQPASSGGPAPARPVVRTVTPTAASASQSVDLPGRTEAYESVLVFTRATGMVKERRFDIGDQVKAGDILAVIDAPEIDRSVDAARATVEQATARALSARRLSDRSAGLLSSRAISQEDYDQRLATTAELEAAVRVAEASLARLEEQQKFATVRAPFDAVVAGRNFDRGDRVRGDSATAEGWLYRLVRLDTLRVTLNAGPDLALRLKPEQSASVRFTEFPGQTFPAKIARTSRIFDPTSGTMRVELVIDNKDLLVPAGLTGTVVFAIPPAPGTFLVPTNTLLVRNGQASLAVVRDGKIAFVEVKSGRNLGPNVEVTSSGLTPDLQIVVNPNAMLRAGDAVDLAPRTAAK
ncbi:MAG TPA: efflux RND transporter periplasmic adaptor subunit [Opitutaceae bacterium]